MNGMDETRAATIIQRNFRKYLSRVNENQNLISKVNNTESTEIEQTPKESEDSGNNKGRETSSSDSEESSSLDEVRQQTAEVYEKLREFYSNFEAKKEEERRINELVDDIETKLNLLRSVSSLEEWKIVPLHENADELKELAKQRHEKFFANLENKWWEQPMI